MSEKKESNQKAAWIILIGLVFFCIVIGFNTFEESSDTKQSDSSRKMSAAKLYNMNENVDFGDWQIKVTDVKETQVLKTEYDSKKTDNNYIVVTLEIQNLQKEPEMFLTSDTKITTSSVGIYSRSLLELHEGENIYVADDNLENYVDNSINIFFDEINPNIKVKYIAVFETSKKASTTNYTLTLKGSNKEIKLYK